MVKKVHASDKGVYEMKNYGLLQSENVGMDSSIWHLPDGVLTRFGQGGIRSMVLSPDGTLLVIASSLGLWWYNVSKRIPLTLWEEETSVNDIVFSACGEWLATSSWLLSAPTKIWEVKNGNCLATFTDEESREVSALIFSPNRERFVVSKHWRRKEERFSCVEIWQLPQKLQDNVSPHLEGIYVGSNPLAFSPDNRLLAFASPDGAPEPYHEDGYPISDGGSPVTSSKVVVYELATMQHVTTLNGLTDVGSISFSPCCKFIAACNKNGTPRVWKIPDQFSTDVSPWHLPKVYQKQNEKGYHFISYTPEGMLLNTVYAFKDDTFSVFDLEREEILYKHPKETGYYHPDFSNGVRLVFESESEVHIWGKGEKHATRLGHVTGVYPNSLHFSKDGRTLLTLHRWSGIFSWDITQPNSPPRFFRPLGWQAEQYLSVDISVEGEVFVTSADETTLRLWELGNNVPIATFSLQGEAEAASFSPAMNLLACRDSTRKIYIWDVAIGELYDVYTGVEVDEMPYLTFSADGKYLACHPCQLYDVIEREKVDGFPSHGFEFQAFSSNNTHVWESTDTSDTITLWPIHGFDAAISLPKPELEPWQEKQITSFAVSTHQQYIAYSLGSSIYKGRLYVWDTHNSCEPIVTFEMPESNVGPLAFSPDNTLLASGSLDGTILFWDMKPYLTNT